MSRKRVKVKNPLDALVQPPPSKKKRKVPRKRPKQDYVLKLERVLEGKLTEWHDEDYDADKDW
jgi:hypothetical protein